MVLQQMECACHADGRAGQQGGSCGLLHVCMFAGLGLMVGQGSCAEVVACSVCLHMQVRCRLETNYFLEPSCRPV